MLGRRLEAAASLVRTGSVAADIGCDHGYLVCSLVSRGVCPRSYACDIGEGPLSRARETVEAWGLGERIQIIRADGLQGLPPEEIDDIIIAGMGGETIASIILGAPWTRDGRYRFILQPMTKAGHLRRALCENGFAITEERAAAEGRFVYTVMAAEYTGEKTEPSPLFEWAGRHLEGTTAESAQYLIKTSRALDKKASGLKTAGREREAAEFAELAKIIRERADKICL